jgi:hypothetical protein
MLTDADALLTGMEAKMFIHRMLQLLGALDEDYRIGLTKVNCYMRALAERCRNRALKEPSESLKRALKEP